MLTPALIELASWTLATEMIRRAPKLLYIMETHPGGGQSDCLTIVRTDLQKWICVFNRIGSFTAFGWFDSGRDCDSKLQIDVWGRIAKGDSTREMIDEICKHCTFANSIIFASRHNRFADIPNNHRGTADQNFCT